MDYKIKKAVVTGASGPVGMALLKKLLAEGIETVIFQREISAKRIYLPQNNPLLKIVYGNLDDLSTYVPEQKDYDVFFHLGWNSTEVRFRDDMFLQNQNVKYSLNAVELAAKMGCHTFIGAGSQAEYGRHNEILKPSTPCVPENGYGIAKLCAGQMTRIMSAEKGMRHIWTRILSIYGPYDNLKAILIASIMNALDGKVMNYTRGEQLWDFLYVDDLAEALFLLAIHGKDGKTYPIGSGEARQLKEYVTMIYDKIDANLQVEFGEIPYGEKIIMHLQADITDITKDTGWIPKTTFADGINKTIEFYQNWKIEWEEQYRELYHRELEYDGKL
ncbi:MAG: NAD(P)-dependent oxidoreductase [Lachnospiraceae bacterium]